MSASKVVVAAQRGREVPLEGDAKDLDQEGDV
jgi:hypothetical protein